MLSIEVEFLMGRAIAAQWQERTRAEWPPHPQRLFSALVAAHSELDLGSAGEAALKWLERLPAPEIRADLAPSFRTAPSYWVPVNDEVIKVEKGRTDFRHLLERRNRQERFFPAVVPEDPVVVFQWPNATGVEDHRDALASLVQNLSYLGHSASPVRAYLRNEVVESSLQPAAEGDYSLRVPGPGRFNRLRDVYQLRLEDESVQPPLGRIQSYATRTQSAHSLFSPDALVLALDGGPKLGLDSTLPLMQHLRNAVLSRLGDSAPEVLTGHDGDGKRSLDAHLAFFPLGFINSKYADGSLKGVALVLPRAADGIVRRQLRAALDGLWQLHLGPLGSISIRLVEYSPIDLASLQFQSYTRAYDCWASVTPVFLDRHPKKNGPSAEEILSDACRRIGLPAPIEVRLGPVSIFPGAPRARDFHGSAKQVDNRARQHVVVRFRQPVRGPILLGAARFMGLGVCMPFKSAGEA